MKPNIVRVNSSRVIKEGYIYLPALIVINNKIYKTTDWHELFKVLMFTNCYKNNRMDRFEKARTANETKAVKRVVISERITENSLYVKFAPNSYIHIYRGGEMNCNILLQLRKLIGDFELYVTRSEKPADFSELIEKKITELAETKRYKTGSIKHLIAHINGKVLNSKEKLMRKIDRDFIRCALIGDISLTDEEESILKEYMHNELEQMSNHNTRIEYEKAFALGLVRVAIKHYSNKTFWRYVQQEYSVYTDAALQKKINEQFKSILLRNEKGYYEDASDYIQNICMHAFVCDKCADQLFNYIFDFWRLDLSYSIENIIDDGGINRFDILVDEIESNDLKNVQDVMIHTTMAVKINPRGCKNRLRRILRMIDESYWNNVEYPARNNRITQLFNEWKNNPDGLFNKEYGIRTQGRRYGRGEKLLSRPTIVINQKSGEFRIVLPKQFLRQCGEDEYPEWTIISESKTVYYNAELMRGKLSLYTNEFTVPIDSTELFNAFEISLSSSKREYGRWHIKQANYRFFNTKDRNIEILDDYLSKDVRRIYAERNATIKYLTGKFADTYPLGSMQVYDLEPQEGDVLLLPDGHAVSIGRILSEGIVGNSRVSGVEACYNGEKYQITADREKLFFKATKTQLNGTSLTIYKNGEQQFFGRVKDKEYTEFKLTDKVADIYGYFIDLHDYVSGNGIYRIELYIPKMQSKKSYDVCYIKGFDYTFTDAPYVFKETGEIVFPAKMNVKTNRDWKITADYKSLKFDIDEASRNSRRYLFNGQLHIEYDLNPVSIELHFTVPVLYWKYKDKEEWMFRQPDDRFVSKLPDRIYISDNLDTRNITMGVQDMGKYVTESEISLQHDISKDNYYFRTVDFREFLDRERTERQLMVNVNNNKQQFLKVYCKGIVVSRNITGDFEKNMIYGNLDIRCNSEYMVTIKFGGITIEEDIPLVNGRFQIEYELLEGRYDVIVYELEEDESGFGSISYELDRFSVTLTDMNSLTGKKLEIMSVQDREGKYSKLKLFTGYTILNLKKLKYTKDILNQMDIHTWLYDFETDENKINQFVYYSGILKRSSNAEKNYKICDVIVVFDNPLNTNEALIYSVEDGECDSLLLVTESGRLATSGQYSAKGNTGLSLDDDLYKITVEIKE